MTKTTTNTNKTTNTPATLEYIPKLIINGQEISTKAKQVACKIKEHEITLNCTYISEHELKDTYKSSFTTFACGKDIEVHYVKCENKVSATIYINKTVAFSSVSMQAVFSILNAAYGLPKSTLNNLYIKSNGLRKQASKNVNSIVVNSSFEF